MSEVSEPDDVGSSPKHAGPASASRRRALYLAGVAGVLPLAACASGGTNPAVTGPQETRVAGLDVRAYGAKWDGSSDDTRAIRAALKAACDAGGGNVHFPVGTGCFAGEIDVPYGVNLLGQGTTKGNAATVFKATARGAKLRFGEIEVGVGNRGGLTGGFVVDGNDIAANPFHLQTCVQRLFESIAIINATETGLLIEYAQNNVFTALSVEDCPDGTGIVLDKGAGGNLFLRPGVSNCKVLLSIQQSEKTDAPFYPATWANRFVHGIFERPPTHATVAISHTGGSLNYLDSCIVVALRNYSEPFTLIDIDFGGEVGSGPLCILGGQLQGNGDNVAGVDVGSRTSVVVRNSPLLVNLTTGFNIGYGANVDVDGFRTSNVKSPYAGDYDSFARFRLNSAIAQTRYSADDTAYEIRVASEPTFRLMADGTLRWFPDDRSDSDTLLRRAAPGIVRSNGWATGLSSQDVASDGPVIIPTDSGLHAITLRANATMSSIADGALGQEITVEWKQDEVGERRYGWPANCRFAGGAWPLPSTKGSARDLVTFVFDGTFWCEKSRSMGLWG